MNTTRANSFTVVKVDEDKRLVSGIAMMSARADGSLITDLQGDQITPDELEKAFVDYALWSRQGDVMHDNENVSSLVEMFVATPEKVKALFAGLGYNKDVSDYKGAAAFVTYKVHSDEAWEKVKQAKLRGFSIYGRAEADEVAA